MCPPRITWVHSSREPPERVLIFYQATVTTMALGLGV